MKLGFVIPVYNHGKTLDAVVCSLLPYNKPIIVVDDGNDNDNKALIQECANRHSEVIVVSCLKNGGKGKAMKAGVKKAFELGLTHVFQIDSDGQHNVESVTKFIEESEKNQEALICGYPVYDDSVPALRKNGRNFANNWAKIVTFDSSIIDSLCGFRIYPVVPYVKLFSAYIDSRMGYDVDILVHMIWKNVPVIFQPVKVTYPKDGISNFRLVRDNIHISLTFTRLCVGMIFRSPVLLARKLKKLGQKKNQKKLSKEQLWYENKEIVKTSAPIRFTIKLVSILPLWLLGLIAFPVSFFYFLFEKKARIFSKTYQKKLITYCKLNNKELSIKHVNTYKHILSFAFCILERVEGWSGKIPLSYISYPDSDADILKKQLAEGKGALVITSHLGNMEMLRSLASYGYTGVNKDFSVSVIMDMSAINFNSAIIQMNNKYSMNIIDSSSIGIDTISLLQERIDKGGIVVIAGDRVSATSQNRNIKLPFLGKEAYFPYGCYFLASLLNSPLYFVFSLRCKDISIKPYYDMYIKRTSVSFSDCSRKERKNRIADLCKEYADYLEYFCIAHPYQWYNFYDFWANI